MARTISRASQVYNTGTYGPFPVDSLTSANTEALEWTLTVENWPDVPEALVITVAWDTGGSISVTYPGNPIGPGGEALAMIRGQVEVPRMVGTDGKPRKRVVTGGTVTARALVQLRTAITFGAVS